MYRLTVFVLVFCVASQRLVGAVRRGESPSGRSNLFFDSYDHPSLEEFEESEDDLREAVLMQPEQVLDIPPIPVKRDYEMANLDTEEPLLEDRSDESVRDSQMTRGFFHDLLEEIQTAFSTWPPKVPDEQPPTPEYHYQLDPSLVDYQMTDLKLLLATVEQKTCTTIVEKQEDPHIIFMGTEGCLVEAVENKIVIGYECFEPTMILKLILNMYGFCSKKPSAPTFKAYGRPLYLDSYRSKMQREAKEDTDCNTHDVLEDWDQKKAGCADTCGPCKNRRESGVCVDYFGCCRYYAQRGYCQKLPSVMKKYCALSCGYCKPKSCVDSRTDCSELKKLGGCQKMPDLMAKSCPRTCNLCGSGVENRDNEERRPPENCEVDVNFLNKYCSWSPSIFD